MSIGELRREYRLASLDVADVDPDPVAEFGKWMAQALRADLQEPHAMALATASADGVPVAIAGIKTFSSTLNCGNK